MVKGIQARKRHAFIEERGTRRNCRRAVHPHERRRENSANVLGVAQTKGTKTSDSVEKRLDRWTIDMVERVPIGWPAVLFGWTQSRDGVSALGLPQHAISGGNKWIYCFD